MCTFWQSIRPTAPVRSVVSYSIKIHSFCCMCYDISFHSPFPNELNPRGRNPVRGTALCIKPGALTTTAPLTVWAARPRDARPPRGCKHRVVSFRTTLSSTYNTSYVYTTIHILIFWTKYKYTYKAQTRNKGTIGRDKRQALTITTQHNLPCLL